MTFAAGAVAVGALVIAGLLWLWVELYLPGRLYECAWCGRVANELDERGICSFCAKDCDRQEGECEGSSGDESHDDAVAAREAAHRLDEQTIREIAEEEFVNLAVWREQNTTEVKDDA